MSDTLTRLALYDDLLRRFASGIRTSQLYKADHPLLGRTVEGLLETIRAIAQHQASVTIGIVGDQFVVADTPMAKASSGMADLIRRLKSHKVERIVFDRGVTGDEILGFLQAIGTLGARSDTEQAFASPHIRIGRITAEERHADGMGSDMDTIRQLYANAVAAAEVAWASTMSDGHPDLPSVVQTVEGLADAVTQNRNALVALTAMRNYDNYTFTHMVNVSILTMGQARALGVEGRLLREFGLSALMHDIGKVRTPKEILNKPDKLTDAEFTIMQRHVVDGAEILRRTPEMPILAPVVAFEHHLRIDGTGYPAIARRGTLNLGTMLCGISDVYDAMRSQRAYQQAFPTDRILSVLKRNDGTQFDRHLVRRFVQLLGVYPPGNMVRLSSGEVAVVLSVHAPDPHRPRVRVMFGKDGARLDLPHDRNLWEPPHEGAALDAVVAPVEPSDYGIDPLNHIAP